jgi:hypothetical protein
MVNPLRGFISESRSLFRDFDDEGDGIEVYESRSIRSLAHVLSDTILGRTAQVSSGGDAFLVNKRSAEEFLERNAHKFSGAVEEGMTLQEKLFRIAKLPTSTLIGLPKGLLEEHARGGAEGKRLVVGPLPQFMTLLDLLEQDHGLTLTRLRAHIFSLQGDKYLEFDRDEFFSKIVEENAQWVGKLSAVSSRPEISRVVDQLRDRLNVLGRKKR